jgi:hypothetical protein
MFNDAASRQGWPKYISPDNDPLFQYHRWKANLRVLDIEEIKSVPHVPMSHPFVERLIGSIRRELLLGTTLPGFIRTADSGVNYYFARDTLRTFCGSTAPRSRPEIPYSAIKGKLALSGAWFVVLASNLARSLFFHHHVFQHPFIGGRSSTFAQ